MRSAVKTRLSLAQRQPANADLNLAADGDALKVLIKPVIVSNIENINGYFLSFGSCIHKIHLAQKSEGARAPSLWMGMTPLEAAVVNGVAKRQVSRRDGSTWVCYLILCY